VVDAQGKVIGITDAYIPPQQRAVAIGFAIPAVSAVSVANQLLDKGQVEHAFIGIQPAQPIPEVARNFDLGKSTGVLVYGATQDAPAVRAGVERRDVLTRPGGRQLESVEDLYTRRFASTVPARSFAPSSCEADGLTTSHSSFRASPSDRGSAFSPPRLGDLGDPSLRASASPGTGVTRPSGRRARIDRRSPRWTGPAPPGPPTASPAR